MKHSLSRSGALLFAVALLFTMGCSKKEPAAQVKSNGLPKATAAASTSALGVAVVNIDSLASQYEYCKEGQASLEAKQKNYSQQINAKGQALQNAMVAFQKKAQSGAFTSQQQAESAQASLQKQQQNLQNFQLTAEREMAKATQDYQDELRARLQAYLADYNKDGRYKLILSKSGDNILYADPAVDITDEVIAGLNKSYKK